jgi:hypothetical protein
MQDIIILIVNSDITELSLMASILADSYDVISARNLEEALFFLDRSPPCRVAYFEISPYIGISINSIKILGKLGMNIVALFRSPCPQLVREAIRSGHIQGLCKLPINIDSFPTHVRKFTSNINIKNNKPYLHPRVLTREELEFLLPSKPESI